PPDPPPFPTRRSSDLERAYMHTTLKAAPFRLIVLNQLYGESISTYTSAVNVYGREADDGVSIAFFGWGPHIAANGREVAFSAARSEEHTSELQSRENL